MGTHESSWERQTGVIPGRVVGRFRRTVEIDQATVR